MTAPRSTTGRLRVAVQILAVGLVGLLGLILVAGASHLGMTRIQQAGAELNRSQEMKYAALMADRLVSEANRRQKGAVVDVMMHGPSGYEPSSKRRSLFLSTEAEMTKLLDDFPELHTEAERSAVDRLRTATEQYLAFDRQAAAQFRRNTAASRRDAVDLVMNRSQSAVLAQTKETTTLKELAQARVAAAQKAASDAQRMATITSLVTTLLSTALVLGLATLISRRIRRSINAVMSSMAAMGEGDLTVECQRISNDELGDLAQATEQTRRSIGAIVTQVGEAAQTMAAAAEELTATSGEMTRVAERSI